MTDYPIVRFVADLDDTTARLDLNDGTQFTVGHEGFDPGSPALEIDPQAVAAPYGERTVQMTVRIDGTPTKAVRALSALSMELLRTRNWLLFQLDASTAPVWFRTFAAIPQALNFENVYTDRASSQYQIPLEIKAEAFVYEAEVELPQVGIANDPRAGGNAMCVVLDEIEGDAPAPLTVLAQDVGGHDFKAPLVSVCSLDREWTPPLWSSDFEFGVPWTAAASYVSGGYYGVTDDGYIDVTPPVAGRYKAILRAGFSDSDTVFDLNLDNVGRVRVTRREVGASQPWDKWGQTAGQGWIDLGVVELGGGWHPVLNPSLDTRLPLNVRQVEGNGEVRLDTMLFLPVDAEASRIEARTIAMDPIVLPDGPRQFYFDSNRLELAASYEILDKRVAITVPGLSGRFPQVIPGRTNVLHLVRNLNTGEDSKGDVTNVRLSYHPRRLYPVGSVVEE